MAQDRWRTHLERLLVETERGVSGRFGDRNNDWQHLAILHLGRGPFTGKLTTQFAPHLAAHMQATRQGCPAQWLSRLQTMLAQKSFPRGG